MVWSLYRWVWLVESPLHVGMAPAGMLNRTRLYVPARALWGALTAELARSRSQQFPDYEKVGNKLREKTCLSYLFPAETVNGQWMAWLPRYETGGEEGRGLVWEREDGKGGKLEERKFRARLLSVRPGTAIEPESDAAAEGTLREFEVVSPYWRDEDPFAKPVGLIGYIFCKDTALLQELKQVHVVWVGGDSRYGLGRLKRVALQEAHEFFGQQLDLREERPVVKTARVLAHTIASSGRSPLVGAMEQLGGWDMRTGGLIVQELTWAPGSRSRNLQDFVEDARACGVYTRPLLDSENPQDFVIREDGLWRKQ